jgi:hypothetical protein
VVSAGSPASPQAVSEENHCKTCIRHLTNKNIPIHLCVKTAFVGSPSIESRRISSFHNFLYYNHYFSKYSEQVYRKKVVKATLTTVIMFFLFTCMHYWSWEILWRRAACEPTAYEVFRDCWKFEKHCTRQTEIGWELTMEFQETSPAKRLFKGKTQNAGQGGQTV